MSQLLNRLIVKIKLYKLSIKKLIVKTEAIKTHFPLLPNYFIHFPIPFALEILYEYCICMVEILYSGVLP